MALALTRDAMLVVGRLKNDATRGFWLDVKSDPPEVPPMMTAGEWTRAGARAPYDCDYEREYQAGEFVQTKPLAPEASRECHALLRRYEVFKAEYANRFLRRYKVDETGVQGTDATGKLVAIGGARVAWKKTAEGASVEVSLPLTAMPRVSEAPLAGLQVWATASSSPPAAIGEAARINFPAAVSFEPLGDLRSAVAGVLMNARTVGGEAMPGSCFSYQPGDPERVELVIAGGNAGVGPVVKPLFEKTVTVGALEAGVSRTLATHAVAMVEGHLTAFDLLDGDFRGAVQRNGQVHLFAFEQGEQAVEYEGRPSHWQAITILPNGTSELLIDSTTVGATVQGWCSANYEEPGTAFSSADYHTFGLRGSCRGNDPNAPPTGFEVAWTWNDTKKVYESTQRLIPVAGTR